MQPQINEEGRQRKESVRMWRELQATEKMLKNILLNSFEEIYFKGKRNRHTGYSTISVIEMIKYLYGNYGVITPDELEENNKRMREAYDPTMPIENLLEQIEEDVEYADAGNATYNDTQMLARAYLLVRNTGMYNDTCREWRKTAAVQQT